MPPGNMLLVVISRSLWECHMKAKPASPVGELAIVPDGGVVPVGPVARCVAFGPRRSEEHTSELQSQSNIVCRLLLEKKKPHMHDHIAHDSASVAEWRARTTHSAIRLGAFHHAMAPY